MVELPDKTTGGELAPTGPTGRRPDGTFLPGVSGNPRGNPNAARVALLRQALLDAVTPEDVAAVAKGMVAAAMEGDSAAANVLLRYTIGEPDKALKVEYSGPRLAMLRAVTLRQIAADVGMGEEENAG